MTDVFVSYCRPDQARAKAVADALRAQGHAVWWDEDLPAHRTYSDVIEEHLAAAKAVVVLWSSSAVKSQWVRAEAETARAAGSLVQARVDPCTLPLPFNQVHCVDLGKWDGSADAPGWSKLAASVDALVGARKGATTPPAASADCGSPDHNCAPAAARRNASVCVLPFANMSGDAEQEYFSDGISEDITTDLSKVSALAVTARNTAFTFKGHAVDVCDLAAKLGVSHVLEGSVRKSGARVRITAQLIDGASGDHVWAERYDRDLTDIFAIQDEISRAIVDALKIRLLPEERRALANRCTCHPEAYNLYLMARQFWNTGNYGDVRRDRIVVRTAQSALALDPDYARAWALMAIAQASLRYHHDIAGDDGLAAAERALELDPTIADAYAVRARHFAELGDLVRADAEIAKGLELDPDSWDLVREAARLAMLQRRVGEGKAHYLRAAELDENDFHSVMMLATCYVSEGDHAAVLANAERMLERARRAAERDPLNAAALGVEAGALAMLGRVDEAKDKHRRSMLVDPDNMNMPYNFACVLASSLHDYDAALDLIEPHFERISRALLLTALADPDMDPLRGHPRFIAAVKSAIARTGLPLDQVPPGALHEPSA